MKIKANRIHYSPLMSSCIGIRLEVEGLNIDEFSLRWFTDYGIFLEWISPGKFNECGNIYFQVDQNKPYWTFYNEENRVLQGEYILINVEILNKENSLILNKLELKIKIDNYMAYIEE